MAADETRSEGPLAAGPALARTIAMAADLALLTARTAGRADLAQRARALRERAAPLADEDAAAYQEFLATRSDAARERTIELPLRMGDLAAEAAELAAEAEAAAEGRAVGGDAMVGTLLAETAARAAALLVRINGGGDAGARAAERAARAAGPSV